MEEKKQKMVPKYHYDQMEKSTRLRLRDEFKKKRYVIDYILRQVKKRLLQTFGKRTI